MSDWFYNFVWCVGRPAFWVSSSPVVLHPERVRRGGPFILAANHLSPYDVPILMAHTPRVLDFVSIVELFRHPLTAWFFDSMGAFPLDRSRPDGPTVRVILDRLSRGRVVAMFPEGHIRAWERSVLTGGPLKPGVGRIAQLAGVPVVPCVVLNTGAYRRFASWFPSRRTIYGVNFGEPITVAAGDEAPREVEARLAEVYRALYRELAPRLHELPSAQADPAVARSRG